MKAKAEEYSFNIESQLFPTLNDEQQKLWKAEIEQAYMAGAEMMKQDGIALRMEYIKGFRDGHKKVIQEIMEFTKQKLETVSKIEKLCQEKRKN